MDPVHRVDRIRRGAVALAVAMVLAGCSGGGGDPAPDRPGPQRSEPDRREPDRAGPERPEPDRRGLDELDQRKRDQREPPGWLGTRVLPEGPDGYGVAGPTPPALRTRAFTLPDSLPALPGDGFASRVGPVPPAVLDRSTWRPGCPVAATDLRWVRLAFRGFDGERHTGELLVRQDAAPAMVEVFRRLWQADFPLEQMRITTRAELDAPPTGDGNNTGAFVCRPVTGGTSYSQHAYGLAVDVNPFQNPYVKGDLVLPELASAYVDRTRRAPGMIRPGDAVVGAFAAVGWQWGGDYDSLKDWQHFSATGG